jgi:hypothetical protein
VTCAALKYIGLEKKRNPEWINDFVSFKWRRTCIPHASPPALLSGKRKMLMSEPQFFHALRR